MSGRSYLFRACLSVICALFLGSGQAVKVGNVLTQSELVQTLAPTEEFMFQFDTEEIFNVDVKKKTVSWRLPEFGQLASFEASQALPNINVDKYNLDIWIKRSNYSKANNVAPALQVYSEEPVIVGAPSMLICWATKFFPPVIKMSWLKNNEPETAGVTETDFYPAPDGSFSKFLYLATVPKEGDVYTCSVEHAGFPTNPTNKFWRPEVPSHVSEAYENIVCGLGLAFGICGIIVGIVLIFNGMKNMNGGRRH
ncbi:H-2 class II histocompatibility antigen, A-Q alpha chain-like [Gastrophryne carolinensis]